MFLAKFVPSTLGNDLRIRLPSSPSILTIALVADGNAELPPCDVGVASPLAWVGEPAGTPGGNVSGTVLMIPFLPFPAVDACSDVAALPFRVAGLTSTLSTFDPLEAQTWALDNRAVEEFEE